MVETTFNIFDVVVVLVMVLSGMLAFFRGFVREVLSLGAWVGAGLITLYYFPDVSAWLAPQLQNTDAADEPDAKAQLGMMVVAFVGTYLTALLSIMVINRFLIKVLKSNKDIGLLDNGLGLIFGLFRAALLLSLGYFVLSFVFPEDKLPPWLEASQTRPYVAKGAAMLAKVAPEYLGKMPKFGEEEEGGFEDGLIDQMLRSGTPVEKPDEDGDTTPNYEYIQTDEFQRLLEQLGRQQQQEQQ
jgi:uncharacterized membrane protein required for colicin V production